MRLLYICARYAPGAYAGGELSAHTALRCLADAHDVDVLVATDRRFADALVGQGHFEGVRLTGIPLDDPEPSLEEAITRFQPDIIYTQPPWHGTAVRLGNALHIPTVLRAPDLSALKLVADGALSPTVVVVQTQSARDVVESAGGNAVMLPPFIDLDRARSVRPKNRKYITMFNPVRAKGGGVFRDIAQRMPARSFAVVPGWFSLRNEQGAFDRRLIAAGRPSSVRHPGGERYKGWVPDEPEFASLQNVTILEPREDVAELYDLSRLVLVPSQWKEQFARVIFEAAANGAVVIASGQDDLRTNVGDAALYVNDYQDPDEWVNVIRSVDDEVTYAEQHERAGRFVMQNYSLEDAVSRFYSVLSGVVSGKGQYSQG